MLTLLGTELELHMRNYFPFSTPLEPLSGPYVVQLIRTPRFEGIGCFNPGTARADVERLLREKSGATWKDSEACPLSLNSNFLRKQDSKPYCLIWGRYDVSPTHRAIALDQTFLGPFYTHGLWISLIKGQGET